MPLWLLTERPFFLLYLLVSQYGLMFQVKVSIDGRKLTIVRLINGHAVVVQTV